MLITSLENNKIKEIRKLTSKKYRDRQNLFLIEGEHLVLEAIKRGYIKEILIEQNVDFPMDVYKTYVTYEILQKITNMNSAPKMIGICQKIEEKPIGNRLLLIDSLQDPGNLGTIIRSAVAFNVDTIVLGNNTVDLYNEKVLRATQGLIFHINIIKRDLKEFIEDIQKKGYLVYGTKVTHGMPVEQMDVNNKYALIVGNEGVGVSKELLDMCDDYIYIPMNGNCESLNVGVASSIILYELNKKFLN